MADALSPAGLAQAAPVKDTDMVILNACHSRERASEKLLSELGLLHRSLAVFATGTEHRRSPGAGQRFPTCATMRIGAGGLPFTLHSLIDSISSLTKCFCRP